MTTPHSTPSSPQDPDPAAPPAPEHRPARRRLLQGGVSALGAGALGLGAVGLGGVGALGARAVVGRESTGAGSEEVPAPADPSAVGASTVPFHGVHQAGIETPAPAASTLLALDLRKEVDRDGVLRLLRLLTDDAARLTRGEPALADTEPEMARAPASLTVTAGFGPGLMERAERPVPGWLAPLPAYGIDALEEQWCGGDLLLQVAALGAVWAWNEPRVLSGVLVGVGAILVLGSLRACLDLVRIHRGRGGRQSDAAILGRQTRLGARVWSWIFTLVSTCTLVVTAALVYAQSATLR